MKTLIITNAKNQQINPSLTYLITAAQSFCLHCDLLVIGAADLTKLQQTQVITQILHWSTIPDEYNLATHIASQVALIVSNYTHILINSDSYGKDLLPCIAGILDISQISDVFSIISPNIFKKACYAGNILAEIESLEDIKLLTVRSLNFSSYPLEAATFSGGNASTTTVTILNNQLAINPYLSYITEDLYHKDQLDLTQAKVIVSGGSALGSKENFVQLIHGLANRLGGGIGASRAAVEAGYASNDCQIGQTGKIVAPDLYIAIGISGAVQHLAGIKNARTVVAVNLDPNAQIFEYADYGIVGDLFEIVPQLINGLSS